MAETKKNELATNETTTDLTTGLSTPLGFDDDDADDMIIPRVKVINALSPERKANEANEGDIINSLTQDKYNGKVFIPVFKFTNNILWRPRSEGGGIACIARNGKHGECSDGTQVLCNICRKNEFDNTKQGVEAIPTCTKYLNFFGFFRGDNAVPIILSFGKTNYKEGKKLYSLAKVSMQNMWNFGYTVDSVAMSKGGNDWFNIGTKPAGPTTEDERAYATQLFHSYKSTIGTMAYDMDDSASTESAPTTDASIQAEI